MFVSEKFSANIIIHTKRGVLVMKLVVVVVVYIISTELAFSLPLASLRRLRELVSLAVRLFSHLVFCELASSIN